MPLQECEMAENQGRRQRGVFEVKPKTFSEILPSKQKKNQKLSLSKIIFGNA